MEKYRIVKEEEINGLGKITKTRYYIEKMWLFFYLPYKVKYVGEFKNDSYIAIHEDVLYFYDEEKVKKYLKYLNEYRKSYFYYKGNYIEKLYNYDLYEYYINFSKPYRSSIGPVTYTAGYQFAQSLERIKKIIDYNIKEKRSTFL